MTTHIPTHKKHKSPARGPGNKNHHTGHYNGDKMANNSPSLQHTDTHLLYLYQKTFSVSGKCQGQSEGKPTLSAYPHFPWCHNKTLSHSLFQQTGHANMDLLLGLYFSPKCCSTKSHVTVRAPGGCKFAENTWLLDSSQQQLKYKPIH